MNALCFAQNIYADSGVLISHFLGGEIVFTHATVGHPARKK